MLVPEIHANRIATRKTTLAEKADASVGAAFVVRSEDGRLTLGSLRGKRAASSIPLAVDGWLAAAGEILAAGYDPNSFFSAVDFKNNAYPDVISALLAGSVDVAILPACLLETMRDRGLIDAEGLTVAAEKQGGLACRHSTALYPDVTLLALADAPEEAVRDVTIAILNDRNAWEYEWLTNVSFSGILSLFEKLQLGPYAYLRDMSPAALFHRHRTEFLLGASVLLFLLFNELRLHRLVRRRTAELARSVEERAQDVARAESVRRRLALFERRSIVQQMGGMIAHEINAPIGAIRTYTAILQMDNENDPDDAANDSDPKKPVIEGIEREAVRIAEIVARVRRYAKSVQTPHRPLDLEAVLERSLRALAAEKPSCTVKLDSPPERKFIVLGDALELELLFLNLLRNAAEASEDAPRDGEKPAGQKEVLTKAAPTVGVTLFSEDAAEGRRVTVRIENDGPVLDEKALADLNSRAAGFIRAVRGETSRSGGEAEQSDFPGDEKAGQPKPVPGTNAERGLGLGLTICRGIADSHGASFRFEGRPQGGARAVVVFDRLDEIDPGHPGNSPSNIGGHAG